MTQLRVTNITANPKREDTRLQTNKCGNCHAALRHRTNLVEPCTMIALTSDIGCVAFREPGAAA